MRILVVDDDKVSAKILEKRAEQLGHACEVVHDGAAAWDRLRASDAYDVVVSGLYQPGLSGRELCRRVRERSRRYLAFIFATAADDRDSQLEAMHAGADDYLTKPIDQHDLHLRLIATERLLLLHRRLESQADELRRLNSELYAQGRQDAVTGIPNRLRLDEDAERLYDQTVRLGLGCSVAMIDVDHFKPYNDTYGHRAGDVALRRIASAIVASSRSGDRVYRYGGEEFVLVLQTASAGAAVRVTERVREAVRELGIEHTGSECGVVTVSAGVATMSASAPRPVSEVLERADAAMYFAKRAGRDRVVLFRPELHGSAFVTHPDDDALLAHADDPTADEPARS